MQKKKKIDILRISDHELRIYSHNWSHLVHLFPYYVNHDHFVLIRSLILIQSWLQKMENKNSTIYLQYCSNWS